MIDNVDQIIQFISQHRPSFPIPDQPYNQMKIEWQSMQSNTSSSSTTTTSTTSTTSLLLLELEKSCIELVQRIQQSVDNTHIRYSYCWTGLAIMLLSFNYSYWMKSSSLYSLLLVTLYCSAFTSYSLITNPSYFPFLLCIISGAGLFKSFPNQTFWIMVYLICSLIFPCDIFSSSVLNSLSFYFFFLLFSSFSFSSPYSNHNSIPFLLFYLQWGCQIIILFLPSSIILPRFCCLLSSSILLYPSVNRLSSSFSSILPANSLYLLSSLFIPPSSQFSIIWLILILHQLHSIQHQTPAISLSIPWCIFTLSIALHFTYRVIHTFSFSSLSWSAAFILTHSTNVLLQAISMGMSVFFAFICVLYCCKEKGGVKEVLKVQVVVVCISTLFNTASPVIWTVFTPLMLFVVVLWVISCIF